MRPPKELNLPKTKALKLLKALYGLKQSGRCWNDAIDEFIVHIGFKKLRLDRCIYVKQVDGRIILLGLYVDDILFATSSKSDIDTVSQGLHDRFQIRMLGSVKKFLSMNIYETNGHSLLNQSHMIESR